MPIRNKKIEDLPWSPGCQICNDGLVQHMKELIEKTGMSVRKAAAHVAEEMNVHYNMDFITANTIRLRYRRTIPSGSKRPTESPETTEIIEEDAKIPECITKHPRKEDIEEKYLRAKEGGKKAIVALLEKPFKTFTELERKIGVPNPTISRMNKWFTENNIETKCLNKKPWNNLTDAESIKFFKSVYGTNANLKGLPLNPSEEMIAELIRLHTKSNKKSSYLLKDNYNDIDRDFAHRLLLLKCQESFTEYLEIVDFEIFKDHFREPGKAKIFQVKNYLNHGIKPDRLISKRCQLWEFQKRDTRLKLCGINEETHSIKWLMEKGSQPPIDRITKGMVKNEEWLRYLYFVQKQYALILESNGQRVYDEGKIFYNYVAGISKNAPAIVCSQLRTIFAETKLLMESIEKERKAKVV